MCEAFPYQSLSFLGDRPGVIYALHAARGPALIFNGLGDTVVGIPSNGETFFTEMRDRAAVLHGSSTGLFDIGFAPAPASHRPYFVTRPVVEWLEKQIDFPNWSSESIRSMPEVRIGDWATQHEVPIDKPYDTDEREAGTRALDVGVPGYSRDTLNALSRDDWDIQKRQLIIDDWLEAARKDVVPSGR
jgi:hypothetical protein